MPLIMIGGAKGSGAPIPGNHFGCTYLGSAHSDVDNASSYTLSVDLGSYSPDRQIIVAIMWGNSSNGGNVTMPSSVTIGDDSSPVLDCVGNAHIGFPTATPNAYTAIYRAVPTNVGSANIVFTPGVANVCYIAAFAYATTDPVVPFQKTVGVAPERQPIKYALTAPDGGFVIAGCGRFAGTTYKNSVGFVGMSEDGFRQGFANSVFAECGAGHLNDQPAGVLDLGVEGHRKQIVAAVSYGAVSDVPPIDWSLVWFGSYTLSTSGIGYPSTFSGGTVRGRMPHSHLSGIPTSPTKARLTLVGNDTEPLIFDKMYFGHASTSGDNCDAADLTEVKFGGVSGYTLGIDDEVISDVFDFAYDGTSDLLITFHVSGDSSHDTVQQLTGFPSATTRLKTSIDEAATLDITGYSSQAGVDGGFPLMCRLELGVEAPP